MRISTQLVMLLLLLNASAAAFTASGAATALGVQPDVGANNIADQTEQTASSFDPGGGFGATLFSLFAAVGGLFDSIYKIVFYGPVMLENLIFPGWFVGMFNGVLSVIVVADVAGIFAGRDI